MHVAAPHRRDESGQGLTEYVIVLALVAIAAIGVVTLFGDNLRALFGASADALAGSERPAATRPGGTVEGGRRTLQDFTGG